MKWLAAALIVIISALSAYVFSLRSDIKGLKADKSKLENALELYKENEKIKNSIENVRRKINEKTRKKISAARSSSNSSIADNLNNEFNKLRKNNNGNEKNKTSPAE